MGVGGGGRDRRGERQTEKQDDKHTRVLGFITKSYFFMWFTFLKL